ncbi:MAG: hypothetical protein ACRDL6_09520 [Solirubrobacterales bacterium]
MELSTVLVAAMVLMMVVVCGGMMVGMVWAMVRRRRNQDGE